MTIDRSDEMSRKSIVVGLAVFVFIYVLAAAEISWRQYYHSLDPYPHGYQGSNWMWPKNDMDTRQLFVPSWQQEAKILDNLYSAIGHDVKKIIALDTVMITFPWTTFIVIDTKQLSDCENCQYDFGYLVWFSYDPPETLKDSKSLTIQYLKKNPGFMFGEGWKSDSPMQVYNIFATPKALFDDGLSIPQKSIILNSTVRTKDLLILQKFSGR